MTTTPVTDHINVGWEHLGTKYARLIDYTTHDVLGYILPSSVAGYDFTAHNNANGAKDAVKECASPLFAMVWIEEGVFGRSNPDRIEQRRRIDSEMLKWV